MNCLNTLSIRHYFLFTFFLIKQDLIKIWVFLFKFQLSLLSIPPNFLTHFLKQLFFLNSLGQIDYLNFFLILLRIAYCEFWNICNSILESLNFLLSWVIINLIKILFTLKNIFRLWCFVWNADRLNLAFKNLLKLSKLNF